MDSARPAATNRGRRPGPATIAALQRSAGNAAVTALLSAPAVQRAIGDGHDLASPRFAGVPILEACFDNQARLREGDGGDPVIRVQQALVDLGADLGPTGADGTYGPKTAAAVRKFKADENLGSEQFGDVGPGTVGRLDELFAQDKPATPGGSKMDVGDTDDAVEEPSSCPSPVELESEIGAGGATESVVTTQALTDTVTAPAADAAGPTPIGATNLDSAVRDFANRLDVPTVGPDDPGNVSAGGHAGREVGDPGDHDPPAVHRCVRGRRKDRKWVVDPAQQDQLDPQRGAPGIAGLVPQDVRVRRDRVRQRDGPGRREGTGAWWTRRQAAQMVHARALSGVGKGLGCAKAFDVKKVGAIGPPSEEHSILIFAHDGDEFAFHDPDATVSNNPQVGFGRLFFADGTLSTATGAGDLPVTRCGDHAGGAHRYQVIRLAPA